jgi:hypothetical protein
MLEAMDGAGKKPYSAPHHRLLVPYFEEQVTAPMVGSAWAQEVFPTGQTLAAHPHDRVCEPQGLATQVAVALRVVVV